MNKNCYTKSYGFIVNFFAYNSLLCFLEYFFLYNIYIYRLIEYTKLHKSVCLQHKSLCNGKGRRISFLWWEQGFNFTCLTWTKPPLCFHRSGLQEIQDPLSLFCTCMLIVILKLKTSFFPLFSSLELTS